MKTLVAVACALIASLLLWWWASDEPQKQPPGSPKQSTAKDLSALSGPVAVGEVLWVGSGDFEREYGKQETSPARDLELIVECWWQVVLSAPEVSRQLVGTNAEHTALILGRHRYKTAYIHPEHPSISSEGELLDRWGIPLFFHRETGRRIGLRSAGPDRNMWNDDDIVYNPL